MIVGDILPEFTLNDQEGNPFSISAIKGGKPVVIYFYPKNFTPGCVKEACGFRDAYEDFTEIGAEVIGISNDTDSSHQQFTKKYKLPFVLLADTKNEVRKLFGVKNTVFGLLPGRETFVFNTNGILIFKFQSMGASNHIKKSLQQLQNTL